MTVKELKKLISKYDDDLEISFTNLHEKKGDTYILYKLSELIKDKNDLIIVNNPFLYGESYCKKDLEAETKTTICSDCGKEREISIRYCTYPPYCEECKEKIKRKVKKI